MPNKTISVPKHLQANRSKSIVKIASWILKYFNWSIQGAIPSDKRVVVVVGPHTSNWDGILGVATLAGLDAKISFIGKHTVFKYLGLGAFLRYMGGIPVDRSKPGGIIRDALDQLKNIDCSLIAMAPEGTRSKVKEWKTGFLRIAKELNTKIILASIDFSKKEILLGKAFSPTGDNVKDILDLKKYYSSFTPRHPEKF